MLLQLQLIGYFDIVEADRVFILVPRSFGTHKAQGIELMVNITENGYVWNDGIVKKAIPSVNLIQLKKDSLN